MLAFRGVYKREKKAAPTKSVAKGCDGWFIRTTMPDYVYHCNHPNNEFPVNGYIDPFAFGCLEMLQLRLCFWWKIPRTATLNVLSQVSSWVAAGQRKFTAPPLSRQEFAMSVEAMLLIHRHLTAGKPQPAATYPVLPGLDGAGCCQRYDASEGGTFQITAMKKAWLRFFSCRCNQNHLKDWSYCRVSQNSEPLMAWEAWVVPVVFNFDFESLPRWELHNLSVGMLREKNWIRRNCWGDIFLST